jgi:DNA-binding FrmR family transcriptional regulator
MPKPKFDRVELNRMIREGKPQKEIAQQFGVTSGAISKAKKELNIAVVKNIALERAHEVAGKNLDAIAQLQKINDYANELLDLLMRWNRGDEAALQILESQVRKVKIGKGEDAEEITEYKFKDPRELALKAMAEIRGQLNLQLEIFKVLYDVQAIAEFQKLVLEAIGEVSSEVRSKIIAKLKEVRALRGSVSITNIGG